MKNKIFIFVIATISCFTLSSATLFAQNLPADTTVTGLFNGLKAETDPLRMEFLLNLLKEKPKKKNSQLLLDASAQYTSLAFAEAGNASKALFWADQIVQPSWKYGMRTSVVHALTNAGKLKDAEQIILSVIKPASAADTAGRSFSEQERGWLFCQYGIVKYKQGKYAEAIPYLAPSSERKMADGAELYILALIKTGNQDQAIKEADILLAKSNRVSEELKTVIKPLYVKTYGNADHYQTLMDSVGKRYDKKLGERLAHGKINEAAPEFEIKDIKGKTVSLKSLKGKTVVIDFWATWCIPCISSFPGMQKAVDYYKSDKSVVFLFIHTWEKGSTTAADAKKIIDAKGYTFDVYMDLKDKLSGKNPLSEAFKLTALPTKVVIDKNGIIRFKNTGGVGPDDTLPEVKAMIDQASK